jgi:glutathione S-transferase
MPPTLYHVPKTISSPIYQALMELNLVDNPIKVETLTFADLKTTEHKARNPMGSSPTFIDDDLGIGIWESGAVLTYLLEQYDTECKLYPKPGVASPADRAKFLHIQQYITATVYPFVASLFLHTLKPADEQDAAYVETAAGKWRTLLAPTLAKFLGDGPYFMGSQMTAIDLLAAKPFRNADSLGILKEFPTLDALFQHVKGLASFSPAYGDSTLASDQVVFKECRAMVLLPTEEEKKEDS